MHNAPISGDGITLQIYSNILIYVIRTIMEYETLTCIETSVGPFPLIHSETTEQNLVAMSINSSHLGKVLLLVSVYKHRDFGAQQRLQSR